MKTKAEVQDLINQVNSLKSQVTDAETKLANSQREKAAGVNGGAAAPTPAPYGNRSDSDESQAMRYFGCSHVKDLIGINTCHPKFVHVPEKFKYLVKNLKQEVDTSRMISQIFHDQPRDRLGTADESLERVAKVKGMLEHRYGREVLASRLKAFGSTVSGGGDEWVPTLISSNYVEEYELERKIEGRLMQLELKSAPFQLPVQSGVTKARKIAENTSISDTSFSTEVLTFSPTKLGEYQILPEELNEDSAVVIIPLIRDNVVQAQIRAVETAIINGDNDGTHLDSDTQAAGADVAEKVWKGWRRQAIANSANGGTFNFSNAAIAKLGLRSMRAQMKKFGVNPMELAWVVGPAVYSQLLALDEVNTVDKYGPQATVLRGALAAYMGIPIIISEYMREDLNATGVFDNTTTNRGGILLVNESRWYVGQRRPIRVMAMQDLPYQDRFLIASYQRKDFQGHVQDATETSVVYGYNIAL